MATTQLFLNSIASDNGGTGEKSLSLTRGAASTSLITNTVTSGNNVPCTDTAGGTAQVFLSPFLVAGQTINANVTGNMRGKESATTANTGAGYKIEIVNGTNSSVLATLLGNTSFGTEYTTSDAAKALTSTAITSYTTVGGERIRVTPLGTAVGGTMSNAAGETFTVTYSGPSGAAGDSWITFAQAVNFTWPTSGHTTPAAGKNTFLSNTPGSLQTTAFVVPTGATLAVLVGLMDTAASPTVTFTVADTLANTYARVPGYSGPLHSTSRSFADLYYWHNGSGNDVVLQVECTMVTTSGNNGWSVLMPAVIYNTPDPAVTAPNVVTAATQTTASQSVTSPGANAQTMLAYFQSTANAAPAAFVAGSALDTTPFASGVNSASGPGSFGFVYRAVETGSGSVTIGFTAPTETSSYNLFAVSWPQNSSGVTGTASATETATASAAGTVATSTGASETVTATASAAGVVGTSSGATVTTTASATASGAGAGQASETVSAGATAAGSVATSTGASETVTASASATGSVAAASGAAQTVTAGATAAGAVATTGAASETTTAAATAAGQVATSTGASQTVTAGPSAAGIVTTGITGSASATETATASAAGSVAATGAASASATATATASGTVATTGAASFTATAHATAAGSGTASASETVAAGATSAGTVGTSTGASEIVTATAQASGQVGKASGAAQIITTGATAAGLVGFADGASIVTTASITASGVVETPASNPPVVVYGSTVAARAVAGNSASANVVVGSCTGSVSALGSDSPGPEVWGNSALAVTVN